jgi:hypothetical protein
MVRSVRRRSTSGRRGSFVLVDVAPSTVARLVASLVQALSHTCLTSRARLGRTSRLNVPSIACSISASSSTPASACSFALTAAGRTLSCSSGLQRSTRQRRTSPRLRRPRRCEGSSAGGMGQNQRSMGTDSSLTLHDSQEAGLYL